MKYIALLRGINVSGQKKILMADLKGLFVSLGFTNVQTYIQSGNVVFESTTTDCLELEKQIKTGIQKQYHFEVPTFVIEPKDLHSLVENNPFDPIKKDASYVTLLHDLPAKKECNNLLKLEFPSEEMHIRGKFIYLHFGKGAGSAKLNNNLIENKLKVTATSRNWRTINALANMIEP